MQVILAAEEQVAPAEPDRQPFVIEEEETKEDDSTGKNTKYDCKLSESEVSTYFLTLLEKPQPWWSIRSNMGLDSLGFVLLFVEN